MNSLPVIGHAVRWQDRLAVGPTLVALGCTLLLPLLVHLIPAAGGAPIGAMLLPLFYAPWVALFVSRFHVAFVAAICAPPLNFLITGQPHWPLPAVLAVELAAFVGLAAYLNGRQGLRWVSAPLAYLGAKVLSGGLIALLPAVLPGTDPVGFVLQSVRTGWPGLCILLLINAGFLLYQGRNSNTEAHGRSSVR